MSEPRLADYLDHMLEAARQALSYVSEMEKHEFLSDKRTQQAVIMNLIIIGEAASKLIQTHGDFLDLHSNVPWRSMKGMRNRITHGYFEVNLDLVWETLQVSLPPLLECLPTLIKEAGHR